MNIFGIGPGELILIMIILLVVVGPERLPGLARQGGQMLVRARNWVQHSPDAAMVLRARQEIEQELSLLRSSLMEVQNARDEVMEVAKQVNQTITEDFGGAVKDITKTINAEGLKAMQLNAPNEAGEAANTATQAAEHAVSVAEAAQAADTPGNGVAPAAPTMPESSSAALDGATSAHNGQPVARARTRAESFGRKAPAASDEQSEQSAQPDSHADASIPAAELRLLAEQMQTVLRDMQSLQQELRGRGLLGDQWQPPSTIAPSGAEAPELTTSAVMEPEERPQ